MTFGQQKRKSYTQGYDEQKTHKQRSNTRQFLISSEGGWPWQGQCSAGTELGPRGRGHRLERGRGHWTAEEQLVIQGQSRGSSIWNGRKFTSTFLKGERRRLKWQPQQFSLANGPEGMTHLGGRGGRQPWLRRFDFQEESDTGPCRSAYVVLE